MVDCHLLLLLDETLKNSREKEEILQRIKDVYVW